MACIATGYVGSTGRQRGEGLQASTERLMVTIEDADNKL